jgi:hypothetical protein
VKLFFQSSSRIRHKSDSIQLTVSLQRDRKENGAESFHCDRIARRIPQRAQCSENPALKNPSQERSRKKFAAEKIPCEKCRAEISRGENFPA